MARSQNRWELSYLFGSRCRNLRPIREDCRELGRSFVPNGPHSPGPCSQPHGKPGLGFVGLLCYFVRYEGLSHGTDYSGTIFGLSLLPSVPGRCTQDGDVFQIQIPWATPLIPHTTPP